VNTFKKNGKSISLAEGDDYGNESGQLIYPIISEGDVAGTVILVEKEKPLGGEEEKLAKVAAQFLGKQMES
jgi:AbrB family transcriptional regulator (stage V sporulation protein T)